MKSTSKTALVLTVLLAGGTGWLYLQPGNEDPKQNKRFSTAYDEQADEFDDGESESEPDTFSYRNYCEELDVMRRSEQGGRFVYSLNYPKVKPAFDTAAYPWMRHDPTKAEQWKDYLWAVLRYAYNGNVEKDWYVTGSKAEWFHVPGLHSRQKWIGEADRIADLSGYGGREGIHGLTRERPSRVEDMTAKRKGTSSVVENWGVSLYNRAGAYTIGKVWENICSDRNLDSPVLFDPGTVAIKLIFTEASVDQVPYLAGSVEWQAHISKTSIEHTTTLRLIQVDVAVRDPRLDSVTGWVFGTFVYDGSRPIAPAWGDTNAIRGERAWYRVFPLGLTWGNDTTAAKKDTAGATQQLFIDNDLREMIRFDLGWMGRLNGPVDNPRSSCVSCHSLAQRSPRFEAPFLTASDRYQEVYTAKQRRPFFERNLKPAESFSPGMISLDYSLQLQMAISNYWGHRLWREQTKSKTRR